MTKYGYCRVANNNERDLELQKEMIMQREMCDEIIAEVYSGIKEPSETLVNLLSRLKKDDTLVVTSLDRLTRNSSDGIKLTEQLCEKGIKVHILNIGLLNDSSTCKLVLNIYRALLETEYNYRSERIRASKEIAKKRGGYKEGRPKKYTPEELDHAMTLLETNSFNEVAALTKISRSTLLREKSKRKNSDDNV